MLMISRKLWLVATLAATLALVGGIATAATLHRLDSGGDRGPAGATGLTAQPEDEVEPPVCPPGQRECGKDVEEGGEEGGQEGGGDGGGGGGGDGRCYFNGGSGGPISVGDHRPAPRAVLIAQNRVEVPCTLDGGWWYDGEKCYYGPPAFNFDTTPPEGVSEDEGRWYQLRCLLGVDGDTLFFDAALRHQWVEFDDIPTVTPQELVQRAIARIGLDGVEFQLAPPVTGAGLVNLPVWLGVSQEPGSTTWGPIEDSECDGGLCVAIHAQVTGVAWNMGDGTEFTCAPGEHKVWQPGMDFLAPGDACHHYYRRDGNFEITATSTWTVDWETTSGGGETGVETTERTSVANLQINEIQVLTR